MDKFGADEILADEAFAEGKEKSRRLSSAASKPAITAARRGL